VKTIHMILEIKHSQKTFKNLKTQA